MTSKQKKVGHEIPARLVGPEFDDAKLINHVLHSNAYGLLKEKGLLYPLTSEEWGNAHHYLVAQACQCAFHRSRHGGGQVGDSVKPKPAAPCWPAPVTSSRARLRDRCRQRSSG